MALEDAGSIDAQQEAIKATLATKEGDNERFKNPTEYTDTFIDEVDQFQKELADLGNAKIKDELSKATLVLLQTALTPENIKDLETKLHDALVTFDKSFEAYAMWKETKHIVTEDDTLSKVVLAELGLQHWYDDPKKLFTGVRKLQEHRENTETVPTINEKGEFILSKADQDPDHPIAGEGWDLSVLSALKSGGQGNIDDIRWYMEKSPRYRRGLSRAIDKLEGRVTEKGKGKGRASLEGSAQVLDNALSPDQMTPEAERLLAEQAAIREAGAKKELEQAIVTNFYEGVKGENEQLIKKVTQLRQENEGWAGYGHNIEPSNLIASIGGGLDVMTGGDGIKTKQEIDLDMMREYMGLRNGVERGLTTLLKTMKGSEIRKLPPMTLKEAWAKLKESGNGDFNIFVGSPEGRLFQKTAMEGKEVTAEDQAEYIFAKAREIHTRVGAEEAEPYYQAVIQEFPNSPYVAQAQDLAMTTGEKTYAKFTQFGDIMLRLDSLAVMTASFGAGAILKTTRLGTATAVLITKYPQLSKVIPGVRVLRAGEKASGVVRLGLGFGNFVLEVGKFGAYVAAAEKVGGEKAAYGVGMLCFFLPGLIHGFEKAAGKTVETVIKEEGEAGVRKVGAYISEQAGGEKNVRAVLTEGLVREAEAAGTVPNRALIANQVEDAMAGMGMKAESATHRVAGLSEAELSQLDDAIDRMFTEKSPGLLEQLMGFLKINFEKVLAGLKGMSEAGLATYHRFQAGWEGIQSYMAANWEALAARSTESLRAIRTQIQELATVFKNLPPQAREVLAPYMAKLRDFLAQLNKHLEQKATQAKAPKAEAPKPEAPKPEAPKPEAPKPEAPNPAAEAAKALEAFKAKLAALKTPSAERLADIAAEPTAASARARLAQLGDNLRGYQRILERGRTTGNFDRWDFLGVTGDHNGELKALAQAAKTMDERVAVLETLIEHTRAQAKPLRERIAALAAREAASRVAFADFGAEVKKGDAVHIFEKWSLEQIQSHFELIRKGIVSSTDQNAERLYADVGSALASVQGRAQIRDLLSDMFGVATDATRAEFKKAYRQMALALHPDRMANVPEPQRTQLTEVSKIVSGAKEFIDSEKYFDIIFELAA